MTCPHCGEGQPEATECRACGVVFARLGQPRARRRVPPEAAAGKRPVPIFVWLPLLALGLLTAGALLVRLRDREPALPAAAGEDPSGARTPKPRPDHRTMAASPSPPAATVSPSPPEAHTTAIRTAVSGEAPSPSPESWARPETVTEEAVRALERRFNTTPEDAALGRELALAYAALGERLRRDGNPDRAVPYLRLALGRDPARIDASIALGAAELARGRIVEARLALDQARTAGAGLAAWHVLMGQVLEAEDRPREALNELRAARALAPVDGLDARIARLEREVVAGADRAVESRRFRAVFQGGTNVAIGRQVLDVLETARDEVGRELDAGGERITAVLYSDQDYRKVTGAPDWAAASFDGKIRLPIGGLTEIDASWRRVVKHELTHALVARKGGTAVPRWLHEGLAQHHEGRRLADFELSASERVAITGAAEPSDPRLFYAQALYRLDLLLARYDAARVSAVLEAMGRGASFSAAFSRTTGGDWDRVLADGAAR